MQRAGGRLRSGLLTPLPMLWDLGKIAFPLCLSVLTCNMKAVVPVSRACWKEPTRPPKSSGQLLSFHYNVVT